MKKKRSLKKRQRNFGFLFTAPSVIGLAVFFVLPFLVSIFLSFSDRVGNFHFGGFFQYAELLKSEAFLLAIKNTFWFLLLGIPILLVLSLLKAILMHSLYEERVWGRGALFTLSLLPMVLPSSVVVQLLKLLLEPNGLFNQVSGQKIDFYAAPYIFWILLFLYIWRNTAYSMVVYFVGLRGIPGELSEQASLDGANKFQIMRKIILPLLKPNILFNLIMAVMGVFKLFRESYLMLGEYPDTSVYMLQNFMNNNFYSLNYNRLSAASVLFFAVLSVFLVFVLKKQGDTDASIPGKRLKLIKRG